MSSSTVPLIAPTPCAAAMPEVAAAAANAASTTPAADFTATNDQTGVAFVLTAKTNCTYTGTAILSNVDIGVDVNGANTIRFSFVSTGAVTESWAIA